jgi:hypothetical protein
MSNRTASGGTGKAKRQARGGTETTVLETDRPASEASLEATEEKVLRMRHGYRVPDDLALEQVGQQFADTAARLREIELRALSRSGRLDELRREVGIEPEGVDGPTKRKIIDKLAGQLSAPAKKPRR